MSPLEECPGETAPALQHAPIMGQPGLPLASTPPTQPCASLECKIFDLTNTHFAKKDIHSLTRKYGSQSQTNITYRIIIIIFNGFAACQQCLQPSSPVLARNALLSVVKGLHQTFTPFFQPYLVLSCPGWGPQSVLPIYPYQMMGPDSTRECVAHYRLSTMTQICSLVVFQAFES